MYSGGFIGCGYGYDNPDDDNADVTCFYQDSSSGAIVFIFNAQSFAKSDATVEATTRVIQTIDGVSKARAFGCFMQAEPATNADALTVEGSWDDTAGGGGAVELWGSRISHQTGNVFGQGATIGVTSVDHAYDNYALQKFETGLFLADTDTSAFTLILAADARSGERITLRNVGGSANDLTIDPAGTGTINGAAAGVSIAVSDGEAITLICAGGGDWWTENNI